MLYALSEVVSSASAVTSGVSVMVMPCAICSSTWLERSTPSSASLSVVEV